MWTGETMTLLESLVISGFGMFVVVAHDRLWALDREPSQPSFGRGGADGPTSNFLLMHAMGPNVAGVIGSAVAAGFMILIFRR